VNNAVSAVLNLKLFVSCLQHVYAKTHNVNLKAIS